jgi:membrane-associated protease RseP (regulator of RpoE activity)
MPVHASQQRSSAARLLVLLLLTLPLLILFFLPGGTIIGAIWFWLFAFLTILLLWSMMGRPEDEGFPAAPSTRTLSADEHPDLVRKHVDVDEAVELPPGVQIYRGTLRDDAEQAYADLKRGFGPQTVPLLQQDSAGRTSVILIPKPVEESTMEHKVRPWLHWLLFALTFLTTTFAGAAHQGINLLREPDRVASGLPYSTALLAILGFHELGHYFTARYHGIRVTPPFFVPVPFALGTFGAFIQMRSPAENRRGLFDVAVAGPLAGLMIALPALYFGLKTSDVIPMPATPEGLASPIAHASVLMSVLIDLSLGDAVAAGSALRLSPLAFAGWLGLLVTALNLIPVGQLDGGHIARALFGTRIGMVVSWLAMLSLFLLALFVWPGLMMWAIIVFFLAGRGTPPLNDVTPLSAGRKALGVLAFIILAAILIPTPDGFSSPQAQDMRCPYV